MDDPDVMELALLHGANKVPSVGWWKWQDLLERRIYQLSMEFLCKSLRHLSVSLRLSWQNFYGSSWLRASAFQTWLEAWSWIPQSGKVAFLAQTSDIDSYFAWQMLDAVYRAKFGAASTLDSLEHLD